MDPTGDNHAPVAADEVLECVHKCIRMCKPNGECVNKEKGKCKCKEGYEGFTCNKQSCSNAMPAVGRATSLPR